MRTNENQLFISYLLSPAFQFHSTLSPSSPHFFPRSHAARSKKKVVASLKICVPHPPEDESMEGCVFIPDVTTESRQWRCKVAVVQKLNTEESRRTPGKKYKPIILQDEAGNRVQAMVYDNDIDRLDKRLEVSSTYIICNASVTSVVGFKNLLDPKYTNLWNITRSTMIQKVSPDEAIDMSGHVHDHLNKFHQIFDYFLSRRPISIMAIVIYKLPRKIVVTKNGDQNVNDFVIMNEECKSEPIFFLTYITIIYFVICYNCIHTFCFTFHL